MVFFQHRQGREWINKWTNSWLHENKARLEYLLFLANSVSSQEVLMFTMYGVIACPVNIGFF